MSNRQSSLQWPVLKKYDCEHLLRIAMPIGGIGTGTISIGGRGDLRDWEIVNRPAKGFTPHRTFFAFYARPAGGKPVARLLEGPIDPVLHEGSSGCPVENHGFPRFRDCEFRAAYPLGQVLLSDPDVPLEVRIEAFNPLIPADPDSSGIPAAILRFVLRNRASKPVSASVCGSLTNFIGFDGKEGAPRRNVNRFRTGHAVNGIFMSSKGVDPLSAQWGTMALTTTAKTGLSWRSAWRTGRPEKRLDVWGTDRIEFWDDFASDGRLEPMTSRIDDPTGALAVSLRVPPSGEAGVTFIISWHFPNRYTWTPSKKDDSTDNSLWARQNIVGNYYATRYRDAWEVAERTAAALPALEKRTVQFVKAICDSPIPDTVKEAALFNLTGLRTQTAFRTSDGRLFGWEGCGDKDGCCHGSCTHVWNYEQATAFLFGDLARTMREVEFAHATDKNGLMSFRVHLPLKRATEFQLAAADGQLGCMMKLYRDWQLSGDNDFLRRLWPHARRALEFCWIKGGWDADQDGVIEGCQHNTMDVEYYGPNPQMEGWYLGALRAGEEMARYLGDTEFADRCRSLFDRGRAWTDRHLFNGEYYEHKVWPPRSEAAIAPGLRHGSMGARNLSAPDFQLASGCLVDQLVGQFMAHICGLGYLLVPGHIRATLRSILRYNRRKGLYGHFNSLRSFALGDETALIMASYPRGRRPAKPFPYFTEVMTGFEYTAAVGMLQEGMVRDGLDCISAVRERYDGRRRSPFNEAECGHHYARAMAAWAAILTLTGFRYSGVSARLELGAMPGKGPVFWSNGYAWGTFRQDRCVGGLDVTLEVESGRLRLAELAVAGFGVRRLASPRELAAGTRLRLKVSRC